MRPTNMTRTTVARRRSGVFTGTPRMISVGWSSLVRRAGAGDRASRASRCAATGFIDGAGRRASSEIRSSSATMTQLATSDEPPYARNGVVRPVSGMIRVTPPTTTNVCSATMNARPPASSLPKPSRTPIAVRMPRSARIA